MCLENRLPEPSDAVKLAASEIGFTTCGICAAEPPEHYDYLESWLAAGYGADMDYLANGLRQDVKNLLPEVRSVIVVTLNYFQPVMPQVGEPRIARYALGRDYHRVIRQKLRKLAARLAEAYPKATFRACVDSAPILEREYAQKAGLGWFGKNTCLIDTHRGSWFFIGVLLSSVEFQPDAPSLGGCGTCTRCIDACPTGAIKWLNGRWSVDARHCLSYLTIEKRGEFTDAEANQVSDWTFGCDVCQEVCPFNHPTEHAAQRGQTTTEPDFLNRRTWPSLVELAQISDADFDKLTEGSAVRRTRAEGLRRNAQANLAAKTRTQS